MIARVLVAGGERGGQLFPGIALVEEMRRRLPQLDVQFVGAEGGFEAQTLTRIGERFSSVDVKPWAAAGVGELARGVVTLPRNALLGFSAVRGFRPDLVIGLGGAVSRAVLASAAALRIPSVLLEQQPTTGLAHRVIDRSAGRVYVADSDSAAAFDAACVRALGEPVRRSIVDAARAAASDSAGVEARARTVLVLGGSRGAAALNTVLPDALARAGLDQLDFTVLHQSGQAMAAQVQRSYRERGVRAEVVPFVDDIAKAYMSAALVIARAGAATMAEICSIGRPSILVPDSWAPQDPRARGVKALRDAGATISIPAPSLKAAALAPQLRALLTDRTRRNAMADAARRRGKPDAAAAIVDDLFGWLGLTTEAPSAVEAVAEQASTPADEAHDATAAATPGRTRPKARRAELRVRPVEVIVHPGRSGA